MDLVQLEDPFPYNAGPKRGALVEARVGKGRWLYVGLGLWRQLPAGTDGAYQLLANLLSAGKAPRRAVPPASVGGPRRIIVGGGPAGATAARALALGGAARPLLDRAAFPRNKPCGGGLTYRVVTRFPDLEAALARITTHSIRRLYMEGPGGESVVVESAARRC